MDFFTADEHFNHTNIMRHCHRPFKWVDEMNEAFIENHNAVVTDEDRVWHLGDFAWGDPSNFISRLRGKEHHLILGNHDRENLCRRYFTSVQQVKMLHLQLDDENVMLWLSHYAHRSWPSSHYGTIHLFGHTHNTLKGIGRSFDIGVDAWNYKPVSLLGILGLVKVKVNVPAHLVDKYSIEDEKDDGQEPNPERTAEQNVRFNGQT